MSNDKASAAHVYGQTTSQMRSVGVSVSRGDALSPTAATSTRETTSGDLARELSRKLKRRGVRLRVHRRRRDGNALYAEKILAEITRRLQHAHEHTNRLEVDAMELRLLLALARSQERKGEGS